MTKKGKAKPIIVSVTRTYIFTQKELKNLLGIDGNIEEIGLEAGPSPEDLKLGGKKDLSRWFIITTDSTEESDRDG